jgi:hypothetical protein
MSRPAYSLGVKSGGGGDIRSLVVTIAGGSATAFTDGVTFKLRMPERGKVVGVTMNVGARGGTHSASAIDVTAGATSLLAAPFDVEAATPGTPVDKEGSALSSAAADVAKDTALAVVLSESGGTSPTVTALTVQIDYVPLGD